MKKLIIAVVVGLALASSADAQTAVRGYVKKDGTYVAPHMRSSPNSTTSDNYSTRGNVNPYTGQLGTKPDTRPSYGSSYTVPTYSSPSTSYGGTTSYGSTSSYGSQERAKPTCTSLYGC